MLFGRIDYQDKAKRLREKSMEFIWKSSPSLGKTGIFPMKPAKLGDTKLYISENTTRLLAT